MYSTSCLVFNKILEIGFLPVRATVKVDVRNNEIVSEDVGNGYKKVDWNRVSRANVKGAYCNIKLRKI